MEKLDEIMKDKLSQILIEDTELGNFECGAKPNFCEILKNKGIVSLLQLFDDKLISKKFANLNHDSKEELEFLISIMKTKYLDEPLPYGEYLSKKIDLNNKFSVDDYCHYFSFEDGEKVYIFDMFVFHNLCKKAYWEYTRFIRKNKDKYPDGKAPFIDYLRALLNSYGLCDKKNEKDNTYRIVQTYIDYYDKDNIDDIKLQADYKNQLIFLRKQLEYCKKMRDDFDAQVFDLENQVAILSSKMKKK